MFYEIYVFTFKERNQIKQCCVVVIADPSFDVERILRMVFGGIGIPVNDNYLYLHILTFTDSLCLPKILPSTNLDWDCPDSWHDGHRRNALRPEPAGT